MILAPLLALVLAFALGVIVATAVARRRLARAAQRETGLVDSLAAAGRDEATREGLLSAVVESAPMAILLLDRVGTMLLANPAARDLFFEGRDAVGENLLTLMAAAPKALRETLFAMEDALFSVETEGETETYHLAKRVIDPAGVAHTLVLIRPLTRELRRQEVAVWKKLLRIISHELNNSLAPISSMAHSARIIARTPEKLHLLDKLFATIEERTAHLKEFLEGYGRIARLPLPLRAHVAWTEIVERARQAHPDAKIALGASGTGYFDRVQLEQVIENLLKNAEEATTPAPEVELEVETVDGGWRVLVRDRGPGMSADVLANALLPFYSTKNRGTGLGLALCREIIEAHGGTIQLQNRDGGGLEVAGFLPGAERRGTAPSRLTLTRG